MKVHDLLLDRHAGAAERRHDGRIAVDERNRRWCSYHSPREFIAVHGLVLKEQSSAHAGNRTRSNIRHLSVAPRISILIPSTGNPQVLDPCLRKLLALTTYENFEVLLLVNERHRNAPDRASFLDQLSTLPRVRLLLYPDRPFNYSWVNNWGARQASSNLLCFLNDDTELITSNWLEHLLARASLPGVGAVGAILFYPDGMIQNAGVILGLRGVAGDACRGKKGSDWGYFGRACLEQDVSCITAACMMVRATVFEQFGGFDEELAIAYNDVDLCIRIRAAGWRIIWTPVVKLYHHESASAGRHDTRTRAKEFAKEVDLMRKRWGPVLDSDPYYNPNLSLRTAFTLAFPPRYPIDGGATTRSDP